MTDDEVVRLERVAAKIRHLCEGDQWGAFTPEQPVALDRAEERLGLRLPAAYRRLMQTLGPTFWPVQIFAPEGLKAEQVGAAPCPLIQFGSDGGELEFLFNPSEAPGRASSRAR